MDNESPLPLASDALPTRPRGGPRGKRPAPVAPVRHSSRTPVPSAASLAHIASQSSRHRREAPEFRVRKSRPDPELDMATLEKWRQDAILVLTELTQPLEKTTGSVRKCSRVGPSYQCELPTLRPLGQLKPRGSDTRPPEVDFEGLCFQSPLTPSLIERKKYREIKHSAEQDTSVRHEGQAGPELWHRLVECIPKSQREFKLPPNASSTNGELFEELQSLPYLEHFPQKHHSTSPKHVVKPTPPPIHLGTQILPPPQVRAAKLFLGLP